MAANDDSPKMPRRTALKTIGAYAVTPIIAAVDPATLWPTGHLHPLVPQQAGEWTPRFLTAAERDAVDALTERIIPATDTPGARAAKVVQYIDWVLSEAPADARAAFRDGLSWAEAESRAAHGRPVAELDEPDQDALLSLAASATSSPGAGFFADLKQRTIEGYYRSEVGMRIELGYDGNTYLPTFDGCTHPEHLGWEPA